MADFVRGSTRGALTAGSLGLVALVALACGGEATSPPTPDAGPIAIPDPIGTPVDLVLEPVSADKPYWAGAIGGDEVLAAYADRLVLTQTGTTVAFAPPTGTVVGAGKWPGGTLVGVSDGFHVVREGGLARSPLSDALSEMRPAGLMAIDRRGVRELWIAGERGLAMWSEGLVRQFQPDGLSVSGCVMTYGSPLRGAPAVWVACEGTLYAMVGAEQSYEAQRIPDVSDVRSLAVDSAGTLWIVTGEGAVWSRTADETLRAHDFSTEVQKVAADRRHAEVWFGTADGVWLYDQATFRAVRSPAGAQLLGAGRSQALLTSAEGFSRAHLDRIVRIAGLEPNTLLEAPTTLTVHPLEPESVDTVAATLAGEPITVGPGWTITLDPEALADGAYELVVTARYAGGGEAQGSLRFSRFAGPPPTWTADVQPIFEDSCALCHGMQGSARRLDSFEVWQDQIDLILENLRTGRMPLPPTPLLSAEDVGRVEGWAAAGFPEE